LGELGKIGKKKMVENCRKIAKIWKEKKNYNSRYAITPCEKAQLEMLALTKDQTKTIEKIIYRKNIA